MIIDCHNHLGTDSDGGSQTEIELFSRMEEAGIDRAVCFPFSGTNEEMIGASYKILYIAKKERRIIPFCRFDPQQITRAKLRELLGAGFRGVKLHPFAQDFVADDTTLDWIYTELEKKRLPVLFHSKQFHDGSHPRRIIAVAKQHPRLPIIIGHFFGDDPSTAELCKPLLNVYSEISISGRALRIRQIVKEGFDRLLFGSDSPYDDPEAQLLKLKKSGLSFQEFTRIVDTNPRLLFCL